MQIVFYLVWLFLITILQPTFARGLEIWGIAPNLFLCFVVLMGFLRGKMEGGACGIAFGMMFDLMIGRMIGVNSLIYLYVGFGAGILSERFFSGRKRMAAMIATIAATVLAAILYYLSRLVIHGDISFVIAIFRISLPESIYNAVVCFLLSYPVAWSLKLMRIKRIS